MSAAREADSFEGYAEPDEPGPSPMGPLLGDVGDRPLYISEVRAMARMYHTGVPPADIAYIFGTTTECIQRLIWHYGRDRLASKGIVSPEAGLSEILAELSVRESADARGEGA